MRVIRSLQARRVPVVAAVGILGIGIGLGTVMFAFADPFLWKALPYVKPTELVAIKIGIGVPGNQATIPLLGDWQARDDLFIGLAAFTDREILRVRLDDRTLAFRTVATSENLLAVLGLAGDQPVGAGSDHVMVSALAAAQAPASLLPGRSVALAPSGSVHIAGFLPKEFLLPEPDRLSTVDVLTPLPPGPVATIDRRGGPAIISVVKLVGRLRPGASTVVVESALNASLRGSGLTVSVVPLSVAMTTRLRNLAIGAVGAGAVLILVCCANVLSLAFTRGLYRASDLITLNALGATPARLARLLLGEGASVAALAAAAGLAVASAAFIVLRAVAPAGYTSPGMSMFTARTTTVVGLAGVAAFMSWCCGSLSAWRIAGHSGLLRVSHGDGRPMRVMRFCVLATQMAGTCFFLAGAAFLGRSYLNLMAIDSGVDVRAMGLSVSYSSELPAATLADSVDRTLAALRRTPGVTAAGASVGGFIDGRTGFGSVMINGRYSRITLTQVSHGYFDAAGMQLVAGRLLEEAERDAVIVNESFVRRYFAGRIPIGYRLTRGDTVQTIVGVIKDVRSIGLTVAPEPGVFEAVREWNSQVPVTYIVSAPDLSRLAGSDWQRIVHAVEPSAVVLDSTSLQQRLNRSILDRTFAFLILGLFALATVVASATGVASVVAHTAARRTREIAIRLALGAKVSSTLWLVMRQTFIAGLCGAFGGLVAAAWVSKTLSSLLYGVPPGDGVTLFLVALGALTVLVFATLLPARRAGGLSPTVALRLD